MGELLRTIEAEIDRLRCQMYEVTKQNSNLTGPEVIRISQELDGKIMTYQKLLYYK